MEVFEAEADWLPKGSLVIDQCGDWRILEKLSDTSWIATYQTVDIPALARLRAELGWVERYRKGEMKIPKKLSDSRWKVYCAGQLPQLPEKPLWWVERIQ
jgi:hypothetical protein